MIDGFAAAVFIDADVVRRSVAMAAGTPLGRVRVDVGAVVREVIAAADLARGDVLRAYWYDGQYPDGDDRRDAQRKYLRAVARTPDARLVTAEIVPTVAWLAEDSTTESANIPAAMAADLVAGSIARHWRHVVVLTAGPALQPALQLVADAGVHVTLLLPFGADSGPLDSVSDEVVELPAERTAALAAAQKSQGKVPAPRVPETVIAPATWAPRFVEAAPGDVPQAVAGFSERRDTAASTPPKAREGQHSPLESSSLPLPISPSAASAPAVAAESAATQAAEDSAVASATVPHSVFDLPESVSEALTSAEPGEQLADLFAGDDASAVGIAALFDD